LETVHWYSRITFDVVISGSGPKPPIDKAEAASVARGEPDQVFAIRHFRVGPEADIEPDDKDTA